ncbi:MAG: rRNA maturation RNase YbeY [Novosphingobium sp.]|nr:rRNA maturation RNase YbeY [Novosphingobium sp.]
MNLDISIDAVWSGETDWESLVRRADDAVAKVVPELANPRLSVSLLLTSDTEIHALNRQWRSKDKPTNVLSFPMLSREELLSLDPEGLPEMLGDIALALETCTREAAEKGVSLEHNAAHLIVHGLLHLAGYDHEDSPAQADAMEQLEIKALALMGIANPYEGLD